MLHGRLRSLDRIPPEFPCVDRHIDLLAEHLELFDGGRALEVARGQHGSPALAGQAGCQLGSRRGLARSLQPNHEDHAGQRGAELDLRAAVAQKVRELVMHDLDELLAGLDSLDHRLSESPLLNARQELARDLIVDVRLEKHPTHLTKPLLEHHRAGASGSVRYQACDSARRTWGPISSLTWRDPGPVRWIAGAMGSKARQGPTAPQATPPKCIVPGARPDHSLRSRPARAARTGPPDTRP